MILLESFIFIKRNWKNKYKKKVTIKISPKKLEIQPVIFKQISDPPTPSPAVVLALLKNWENCWSTYAYTTNIMKDDHRVCECLCFPYHHNPPAKPRMSYRTSRTTPQILENARRLCIRALSQRQSRNIALPLP